MAQQYINNEGYNCTSTEYQHIENTKEVILPSLCSLRQNGT
jgi:hypothetical protein